MTQNEVKESEAAESAVKQSAAEQSSDPGPAPAAELPGGLGAAIGGEGSAAPPAQTIKAAVREAVAEAFDTARSLPNDGARREAAEFERIAATLSRVPEDLKAKMESVFGVLLDRLEDSRGIFSYNRQKRLFLDLLSLHDLMLGLETGTAGEGADEKHRANYANLREQLLQLLAVNGVTPLTPQLGSPFIPQQHQVVRVVQTSEAGRDGEVESTVRSGFAFGPFVVRPAQVVVRKLSGPDAQDAGTGAR